MSTLPLFPLPGEVTSETPFGHLHIWQWAGAQDDRNKVTLCEYLLSIGFVTGAHRITEQQYEILSLALDHYRLVAPHMPGVRTFDSLFTLAPENYKGEVFWVQGKPGRYILADEVRTALFKAGWIYDVQPDTTYFAVINGTLWAKYQSIIGSRALARIEG